MSAIEAVLRGDLYLDPSVTRALLRAMMVLEPANTQTDALPSLTTREMDVMRLLGDGYTNAQIAKDLRLSVHTIQSYRSKLVLKLGTRSRADMVRLAMKYHLALKPKVKAISQHLSLA